MSVSANILQTLFDGRHPLLNKPLATFTLKDSDIAKSDLLSVFNHSRPLGISPGYLPNGSLVSLAIADNENCRVVEFQEVKSFEGQAGGRRNNAKPPVVSAASIEGRNLLQNKILCRPAGDLLAFDMGPLAMALYTNLKLRITHAVDIQSAFSAVDRKPITAIKDALGKETEGVSKIKENVIKGVFLRPVYDLTENMRNRVTDLAMRAWVSQLLRELNNGEQTFEKVKRIDTKKLPAQQLEMISKIGNDSLRLDSAKPIQTTHRVTQGIDPATGGIRLQSQDYNNKLRNTPDKKLTMRVDGTHGEFTVNGSVAAVTGRAGYVNTGLEDRKLTDKVITGTVITIGRDDPTTAEAQRAATILRILQGSEALLDESPWIQNIWFPASDDATLVWPEAWKEPAAPFRAAQPPKLPLNASQQLAVNTMVSDSDDHRITIVQGPPGTGKTSVIASYVDFSVNSRNTKGIWLVAQSNVAVKNIAEKLISSGFIKWKILVSKDFHFDWHEHIYAREIENYLIRSDQFFESAGRTKLRDVSVILSTLSMLSNKFISKFTLHIPVKILVVDEASQIEIGQYISVFSTFKNTLRKVCFIGDDKQLPPFGQEDLQDLQSIFEVPHLKKNVLFLDTQYRMPPQIGQIISKEVYDNNLKSNPLHCVPNTINACYFIDVGLGKESQDLSGSFKNELECQAVLALAEKLQERQAKFKIITPYAAQTADIEKALRKEKLDYADKCFNVDAFQGNEEDYIIISVVRTQKIGFLSNLRRTNVMLSRCKKGMFIVSSATFLKGKGENTLVGKFFKEMEPVKWLNSVDIDNGNFDLV